METPSFIMPTKEPSCRTSKQPGEAGKHDVGDVPGSQHLEVYSRRTPSNPDS